MPILTQDIKLLKSSVMADTTDGGGQMTGVEVIDGQSNNLFPDTSAMDRAFGRVNMRKVFGVAHTTDTNTLMGSHAIITDAPDDPLVHCTLIKTPGWADTRTTAREAIEKYLVKGPRASVRIYDTHYAGSLQLRLITFVSGAFPTGGDAIVLQNPNGTEQYVRVLKVSVVEQDVAMIENNNTVVNKAKVATCDLGSALALDVLGPPAARTYGSNGVAAESAFASLYTTSIAAGAKFYGVKPLGTPGVIGDLSVTTDGGIYTPVVPAATIETPVIDQYPLADRSSVVAVGYASVTLPAVTMTMGPNAVVTAPTPIGPTTVALTAGANSFTDDGAGVLLQGTTAVGTVDYAAGKITLSGSAPSYGTVATTLTYKAGTRVTGGTHSASRPITIASGGLSYTEVFSPVPARGSFKLDFMAQGRWYTLSDNGNGKLSGSEPGYGTGNINYATGSMSVTLGAIPDIGSKLIASWGNTASGVAVVQGTLPTSLGTWLYLNESIDPSTAVLTWSKGAANYTATAGSNGILTGDATGSVTSATVHFNPSVFPDGAITVTSKHVTAPVVHSTTGVITYSVGGVYTLTQTPVNPGSLKATIRALVPPGALEGAAYYHLGIYDRGGVVYIKAPDYDGLIETAIGTVDYATGSLVIDISASWTMWLRTLAEGVAGAWIKNNWYSAALGEGVVTLDNLILSSYTTGTVAVTTSQSTYTPASWHVWVNAMGAAALPDSAVFSIGNEIYTVASNVVRKGWNSSTGAATVATAGSATVNGQLTITSLPANGINTLNWYNMALKASVPFVSGGVFRVETAPLKVGVFQLFSGANIANGNDAGVISGGSFSGTVDYTRGIVTWSSANYYGGASGIAAETLSYNSVYLQYLPLEASLLGIETARLPLDGKVPIYRRGDLVVVHNTLTTVLPNPLVKGTVYPLGRERIASVRVKDALGVVVPDTLYTALLDPGTLTVPVGSVITSYTQPLSVEHRIEDMLLCSTADISGQLKFTRSLTHNFPADTSFVSSAMPFGDLFARVYGMMEQATWTSVWSDTLIGSVIIPQFNDTLYPIVVTNAGAIKERWVLIFSNTTSYRIIGESVGEIGSGNTGNDCAPVNPATGVPYFTLPASGWGSGWATGNCLRFNTDACGTPFWAVRTVLQGPPSIDSDQFTLAFRGDVDRA